MQMCSLPDDGESESKLLARVGTNAALPETDRRTCWCPHGSNEVVETKSVLCGYFVPICHSSLHFQVRDLEHGSFRLRLNRT